ncbi:NUDIX domain-containing protein [Palleronia pelagia]|uniref:ADP-ribose pyrophosphatase n=1 Tax=Palleronia pelagia TaxID=387096 RepID=A0A1H8AE19_9RHOB|nr:gamma-glutamylcyclotransferase [Palleronia pelagia]SEM68793.1 nudix-type nucleoside diphosphatase, YffH/AdpP family [Palleronia pelagia]
MPDLFLFGTLLDASLRDLVAGGAVATRPAVLDDHAVNRVEGADFPALVAQPGTRVEGLLLTPDATQMARLHFYEEGFGFGPEPVTVIADGQPVEAIVYRPRDGVTASDTPWDLAAWQQAWGALTRRAARESMGDFGQIDGATLRERVPMIFTRADAALRAESEMVPCTLRASTNRDAITVDDRRVPYAKFFAVEECDLRHPLHGGGQSPQVTRASFVMSDAVTVLPYDPARDRVMLVEQFRFGPFARGDLYPYALEPIAGRIDPGEGPEQTARREAMEEARLSLGPLHLVARYYPSPGATTEYLYSYVAEAELPDGIQTIAGSDAENEDIRTHVITFTRLLELMESGEVDVGHLLVSVLWLQRERAAGRFA